MVDLRRWSLFICFDVIIGRPVFSTRKKKSKIKNKNENKKQQPYSERALAAVKIAASDVDVIVREFDLPKAAAERALREAGGDAKAALSKLCGAA